GAAPYQIVWRPNDPQRELPMTCFSPSDLPVLNQLAREFVLCDRWFSSLPGPTWPNRFWIHGASPTWEGQSDSPSNVRAARSILPLLEGGGETFQYPHGTIWDRL